MPALLYVLALGAFGIITTELGVIGILPQLSQAFSVSIQIAGWLLSGFALTIAVAGPAMTLLFSRIDRKSSLCLVLALFVLSNIGSAVAPSFGWLLALRVLRAFLHRFSGRSRCRWRRHQCRPTVPHGRFRSCLSA